MARADKKQRHNAKRGAKRQQARRRASVSPVKRLADAPGEAECWLSEGFGDKGQATIFAYKRAAGVSGLASFLIDRGVVGLKDAWTRLNMDRARFNEMLDLSRQQGIQMNRVPLDTARAFIAGAVRWAHDNGMRLPKDWIKAASLLGGVGEWKSADISAFAKEFVGHPEDLRQRLVGESFETYIARTDVDFIFGDAPYLDQETGEYVDEFNPDNFTEDELEEMANDIPVEDLNAMAEQFIPAATTVASQTQGWLSTQKVKPSAQLVQAWRDIMLARCIAKMGMPDASENESADLSLELLEDISKQVDADQKAEYRLAITQALNHLETDPLMMQKAILKHALADMPET